EIRSDVGFKVRVVHVNSGVNHGDEHAVSVQSPVPCGKQVQVFSASSIAESGVGDVPGFSKGWVVCGVASCCLRACMQVADLTFMPKNAGFGSEHALNLSRLQW